MNLLENKVGLVLGVANKRSIAWACADACHRNGALQAFSYQGDRLKENVEKLAGELPESLIVPMDVTNQAEVDAAFEAIGKKYGKLDYIIHSIAFAPREALEGDYVATTRDAFRTALEISAFSLNQVAFAAAPLMKEGGSLLTLSYLGAERVMPHYNVMGVAKAALEASVMYIAADLGEHNIRVNAISAGPLKTLAASGIGDFRYIFKWNEYNAPLKRNTTLCDVGGASVFLLSDLGKGTTGEVLHVDGGAHAGRW